MLFNKNRNVISACIDTVTPPQYTTYYMVAVKMMGRLGNQMFQYACAYAAAQHHATTVMLDISHIAFMPAFFLLDRLNITTNTYSCFGIPSVQYRRIIEGIKRRAKHLPFVVRACDTIFLKIRLHTHVLDSFCYDDTDIARPFHAGNRVYLDGYFQSFKYFQDAHIADALRSQFTLRYPLSPYSSRVLAQIQGTKHSVAVHIRRADYVEDGFEIPSIAAYYAPAIATLKKKLNATATVFVFSDDIIWVKEHFSRVCDAPVHVVDGNTAENCYEDMYLISQCEHQIITNSTFSWWGAWLNTNSHKIVIAPKIWLGNRYPADAIIFPDWIRL